MHDRTRQYSSRPDSGDEPESAHPRQASVARPGGFSPSSALEESGSLPPEAARHT